MKWLVALLLCLSSATSGVLQAQERPLWEIGAGAFALSLPDYRGSDHRQALPAPFPYLVYRGERLKWGKEGGELDILQLPKSKLDLSLAASPPVNSEANGARADMPDLDPAVEIGPRIVSFSPPTTRNAGSGRS